MKRIEAIIEADRIMPVRRVLKKNVTAWCAPCHAERFMFTIGEAATLLGTSSMNVSRSIKAGYLHGLETSAGSPLVCPNSLLTNRGALLDSYKRADSSSI